MTSRCSLVLLVLVLLLFGCIAGCLSYSFGAVAYDGEELHVQVFNTGEPREVVVQATIFRTEQFSQTEVYRKAEYKFLEQGENEYRIPIDLEPGTYKIYLYVMIDGDRAATEIRDIEIQA
ncbi:MAG: hypothetical protein QCH35_02290 [Methanomicrobiaceae archaeon]|nr:hypothetical protein [Methanomicrobiaceae archaeon]